MGKRLPKKLAALGSGRPFFRFDVNLDQQKVLDETASVLQDRALFVYAAPVFAESSQLFYLQRVGQLVENSTFPDVRTLTDHRAWYYNQPGATGVVNQDYEFVDGPTLSDQIASLVEAPVERPDASPSDDLDFLASTIERVILEAGTDEISARTAYLADDWRAIDRYADQYDLPRASRAFLKVDAFVRRLNLEWFVLDDRAAA